MCTSSLTFQVVLAPSSDVSADALDRARLGRCGSDVQLNLHCQFIASPNHNIPAHFEVPVIDVSSQGITGNRRCSAHIRVHLLHVGTASPSCSGVVGTFEARIRPRSGWSLRPPARIAEGEFWIALINDEHAFCRLFLHQCQGVCLTGTFFIIWLEPSET